ncbi:hypothetical protein V1294_006056 [Bradyrhizobium sp. AZCC 1678]|uniref:hypothetical protein n=1 Tax=Bradyrhizobium sp. AZCC 1678 TaxID=3117030 RepID=UPI002FF02CE7
MSSIWHAILSTNAAPPVVGSLWLVAMPTPTTNPHAVGRILSVARRPGGHMPTWNLTVAVENDDDAVAKRAYPHSLAIDCYATPAEAERWHAVDLEHFGRRGYARNHWPEGS